MIHRSRFVHRVRVLSPEFPTSFPRYLIKLYPMRRVIMMHTGHVRLDCQKAVFLSQFQGCPSFSLTSLNRKKCEASSTFQQVLMRGTRLGRDSLFYMRLRDLNYLTQRSKLTIYIQGGSETCVRAPRHLAATRIHTYAHTYAHTSDAVFRV